MARDSTPGGLGQPSRLYNYASGPGDGRSPHASLRDAAIVSLASQSVVCVAGAGAGSRISVVAAGVSQLLASHRPVALPVRTDRLRRVRSRSCACLKARAAGWVSPFMSRPRGQAGQRGEGHRDDRKVRAHLRAVAGALLGREAQRRFARPVLLRHVLMFGNRKLCGCS